MCSHMSSCVCSHMLATRASTCFLHVRARYLFVRARLLFKNVRPGRMFSYCVRARAYTHVLARVYSTRASTCTIYTCFTLPPTRVNPTGLQLSIFQNFGLLWPILEHLCCQTNFMVGLNRIETTLTLTLTTVEAISENLGRVWFVYNSYICKRITLCRPLLTSSVNSAENEIPDAP